MEWRIIQTGYTGLSTEIVDNKVKAAQAKLRRRLPVGAKAVETPTLGTSERLARGVCRRLHRAPMIVTQ